MKYRLQKTIHISSYESFSIFYIFPSMETTKLCSKNEHNLRLSKTKQNKKKYIVNCDKRHLSGIIVYYNYKHKTS